MALSMDEQRVLAEIEKRLAAEEPKLAACMTAFRRPGPGLRLKSPRARILGSLFTVALVAVLSLMVYAMLPFRTHMPRMPAGRTVPASLTASNPGSGHPGVSAGASTHASTTVASPPVSQPVTHSTAARASAASVGAASAGAGAKSSAKNGTGPAKATMSTARR